MHRGIAICGWLVIAALASWASADEDIAYQPPRRLAHSGPLLSPSGPPLAGGGAIVPVDAEAVETAAAEPAEPEAIEQGEAEAIAPEEYVEEAGPIAPAQHGRPTRFVAQHPNPGEPLGFSGSQFAPRPGPSVDPSLSAEVFDVPYVPSYFDPADPDAPAPSVSSGEWLRNGRWYTEQSVIYWSRTANIKNDVPLSFEFISILSPPTENELNVQLDLGYQPGLRSTLGRYLGRDVHNRDHSLEFTFLGLTHWQFGKSITGEDPGTVIQILDPFANVPVFEDSDTQSLDVTSDFNSYEFNYRIDRRLGRDRMVYTRDSSWVRQATPSLLCSLFAGLRVAIVNERLDWTANNVFGDGRYLVVAHNNMVGPQIGADLMYEHTYWRAGVRASGGSLVNWASQSSTVRILDLNGNELAPNRDEYRKSHSLSFVGGLNFIGEYRFRPSFGLRVSYDLMYVTDLALAQNQLTFFPSSPAEISNSHALFFQGVSLGFEWFR